MIKTTRHQTETETETDQILVDIANYCLADADFPEASLQTATCCLMDAMGCAILALENQACHAHIQPLFPVHMAEKSSITIPGTQYRLDPIQAAYTLSTMIRWLDFNDTWLAKEWGHPSDNLGALLMSGAHASRQQSQPIMMQQVLEAMIKAYEIQGLLAIDNSFNQLGFDHVILVRIASTALAVKLLQGNHQQLCNALSHAFIDGAALRTYRHAPNTGWRKSWAAGDASSRGLWLALRAIRGEMGYPTALTATQWGFNDVLLNHQSLQLSQPFDHYVMDNILFKIAYPAEFHAQTAAECAIKLHAQIKTSLDQLEKITLHTQQAAMQIINKTGPLSNQADRDHCLQYIVAVSLLTGELSEQSYHDDYAANPELDQLRTKMEVVEDPEYTNAYFDINKRAIPNRITLDFKDGRQLTEECWYPLGHRDRRTEGLPQLTTKFIQNLAPRFTESRIEQLVTLITDWPTLAAMPIEHWLTLWQPD